MEVVWAVDMAVGVVSRISLNDRARVLGYLDGLIVIEYYINKIQIRTGRY